MNDFWGLITSRLHSYLIIIPTERCAREVRRRRVSNVHHSRLPYRSVPTCPTSPTGSSSQANSPTSRSNLSWMVVRSRRGSPAPSTSGTAFRSLNLVAGIQLPVQMAPSSHAPDPGARRLVGSANRADRRRRRGRSGIKEGRVLRDPCWPFRNAGYGKPCPEEGHEERGSGDLALSSCPSSAS